MPAGVRHIAESMHALALRFCGNHHDAEDLSQEVFLNAYRAMDRFRGDSSFHTWLRRIMVNSFLSHKRRKELPRAADVTEGAGFPIAGSDRTAFNNVMVQQILQRLEEVPARQRLMFMMKHQEGLTCEEIADYFGTTRGHGEEDTVSRGGETAPGVSYAGDTN